MFEARIAQCVGEADAGYEGMKFRDALKFSFFEMLKARDAYRDMCIKLEIVRSARCARVRAQCPWAPH